MKYSSPQQEVLTLPTSAPALNPKDPAVVRQQVEAEIRKLIPNVDNLNYVIAHNGFFEWYPIERKWEDKLTKEAIQNAYPYLSGSTKTIDPGTGLAGRIKHYEVFFNDIIVRNNRRFRYMTSTYDPKVAPDVLNRLSRAHWMLPKTGKHSPYFDVLLNSLGGGKKENIEHIKHVIGYKLYKPHDFLIPALCFWPGGSVGKSLLSQILSKIVTPQQCARVMLEQAFGTFNTAIEGKAFVFVEESALSKANMESIKYVVGNDVIKINTKNTIQYDVAQTALYIFSSNDDVGPITVDQGGAGRRFSWLHVEKPLWYWIAIHDGLLTEDDYNKANAFEREELQKELKEHTDRIIINVLLNEEEIAKWYGHLISEVKNKSRPHALHGQDYLKLADLQQKAQHDLAQEIFEHTCPVTNKPDFTHITLSQMYELYLGKMKTENSSAIPIGKKRFNVEVQSYVKTHGLPVEYKRLKLAGQQYWVFVNKNVPTTGLPSNDAYYQKMYSHYLDWKVKPRERD